MNLPTSREILLSAAFLFAVAVPSMAARQKFCITPEEASTMLNQDVCISAHVYNVVQLPDGTRFLDICSPDIPDDRCRFTLVSLWEDHDQVGELLQYRDTNVQVRGIVRSLHGRSGVVVSHSRQFYGGPPRFKPNPRLLNGFRGDQDRPPIRDPNLRSHGGGRSFMNRRDQEALPSK